MRALSSLSCLFLIVCLLVFSTGCGSSDGGLSDWQKPATVTAVSNIKGKILPPSTSGAVRGQFSLLSTDGTLVFVEEKPEFFANADANGDFLIRNVEAGRYRLVAHKVSGTTPYRQRSDIFTLSGQF
ncbi:MAG: hypothetical protein PHD82_14790, partial [Candidatus Riflebacteria bacterium]|nr:hypothetical protein [Candidatus Riflebacteria bacterium]